MGQNLILGGGGVGWWPERPGHLRSGTLCAMPTLQRSWGLALFRKKQCPQGVPPAWGVGEEPPAPEP